MKTLAVFLSLLLSSAALAQEEPKKKAQDLTEMSLEELSRMKIDEVQGASRYVQKISQAPSSVTVITADDIKKMGYRTLADVLRAVRGVYVTYDRNYSYVGVRGFGLPADYNNRLLFLVDGHRANDAVYDGTLFGSEFILDVDTIERVEFIRGPGSALYGSNAFFGVVNILTRKGKQIDGAEVSASAGSFDSYKGRASFGTTLKGGLDLHLSASVYGSQGQSLYYPEFDDPATNDGHTRDADGESYYNLFGQLTLRGVTVQAAYVSREKTVPNAPYDTVFPSENTKNWDERGWLDVRYEREFEGGWDVLARVFYDSYWYHGEYEYEDASSGVPVPYLNMDYASGYWWGSEVKLTKTLFEDRLKLTAGGEFRDNLAQDQKNYDETIPMYVYLDSKEESTILAAFGQADASLRDGLRVNAGVRLDHYDTFGNSVNPRLAVIVNPLEETTIKGMYGRAFRAPCAYEMYYSDGYSTKSNPDLDPETIDTFEVALEQDLWKGIHLTATGFHYQCKDMIQFLQDPADGLLYFDNVSKVNTTGGEVEVEARLEGGYQGRLSYSYQKAEDDETGEWIANSPKHLAKLAAVIPLLPEKLFLDFELQYVGERRSVAGDTIDDYLLANLTIFSREILKGLELSASIYNLFDQEYYDPGGLEHTMDQIEQDGTTFRVKLTYRF